MVGFEEDYEAIEEHSKFHKMIFGEWLFFAFGFDPNTLLDRFLGNCDHYKERSPMKHFAYELLESGQVIFEMSEKYRKLNSNGGMGHT